MTVVLVFPTVVGSFPLGFSSSDSALAPLDSFTLGLTFPLGLSSESESPSLLSDSLAARLEEDVAAPSFDVDADVLCPSSTKLMSSGETWALTPRDQVGCLMFVRIDRYSTPDPLEDPENWCYQDKGGDVFPEQLHRCLQRSLQLPEQVSRVYEPCFACWFVAAHCGCSASEW